MSDRDTTGDAAKFRRRRRLNNEYSRNCRRRRQQQNILLAESLATEEAKNITLKEQEAQLKQNIISAKALLSLCENCDRW